MPTAPASRDRGPARVRRGPADPAWRRSGGRSGQGPRPDGPERLGQVDARQRPARQPGVPRGPRARSASRARTSRPGRPTCAAKAGIFLAFQYPESIGGVPVIQFLRQALSARRGIDLSVLEVRMAMIEWMEKLGMDPSFGERHLNEGFSGGEKQAQRDPPDGHCSSPSWRSSTRPTRASTSTRSRPWPAGSRRCARSDPSSACS